MSVWSSGPWFCRSFPNPFRYQNQNYIQFHITILPRNMFPLCLVFSVWKIKIKTYKKKLAPWVKHKSGAYRLTFHSSFCSQCPQKSIIETCLYQKIIPDDSISPALHSLCSTNLPRSSLFFWQKSWKLTTYFPLPRTENSGPDSSIKILLFSTVWFKPSQLYWP